MNNSHFKMLASTVSIAPLLYLAGLAASFLLYVAFPINLFSMRAEQVVVWIGFALVVIATGLVFWAQTVSRQNEHRAHHAPTVDDFMQGPYRYSRHPGALGLMIMFVGFALVVNSLIMIILAAVFIILDTTWFIPTEESVYMEETPDAYAAYRKKVRMWL